MYVKQGLPMLWAIFSSVQRKIVKRAVSRVKFPCVLGSQLSRSSSRLLNLFMPYLKVQTELVFASNSVSTHSKRSINLAISLQKLYFICHPFLSLSLSLPQFSISLSIHIYFPQTRDVLRKEVFLLSWQWPWVAFINPILFPLYYEKQPSLFMEHPWHPVCISLHHR